MQRYFAELSYKGTNYHGWQKQHNAHSVQEVIEKALSVILGHTIESTGCGRTDTGVHARQFFVHFDTAGDAIKDEQRMLRAVNALCGQDISVKCFIKVDENAHARFDATSRSYEYYIHHKKDPFLNGFSFHYDRTLDIDLMNEAAKKLLGQHDFECFSKSNTQVNNFLCNITRAEWKFTNVGITFYISANRFLRNMVRAIVGTLLEVGRGETDMDGFVKVLENKNRSEAGMSVPAEGLYLTEIIYPYIK